MLNFVIIKLQDSKCACSFLYCTVGTKGKNGPFALPRSDSFPMTISSANKPGIIRRRDSGNKNPSEGLVSGADYMSTVLSAAPVIRRKRAGDMQQNLLVSAWNTQKFHSSPKPSSLFH